MDLLVKLLIAICIIPSAVVMLMLAFPKNTEKRKNG